jgi:hypothetical protein
MCHLARLQVKLREGCTGGRHEVYMWANAQPHTFWSLSQLIKFSCECASLRSLLTVSMALDFVTCMGRSGRVPKPHDGGLGGVHSCHELRWWPDKHLGLRLMDATATSWSTFGRSSRCIHGPVPCMPLHKPQEPAEEGLPRPVRRCSRTSKASEAGLVQSRVVGMQTWWVAVHGAKLVQLI